GAAQQVVDRLLADEPEEVATRRGFLRFGDVPTGVVRGPAVEDLPLLPQDLHRLPDLVPRRRPIDVMELVEVDDVGLQPLERRVAVAPVVSCGEATRAGAVAHRVEPLRREHRALATLTALREPASDDRLGGALPCRLAIDVRGVEEVDPFLERAI